VHSARSRWLVIRRCCCLHHPDQGAGRPPVRRGAFIKQIAPDKGGHSSVTRASDRPSFSGGGAAHQQAGISRHWQKKVLPVAAAHREVAEALQIKAAAKRRLADEYDAKQP